jgi:hypothetical protein
METKIYKREKVTTTERITRQTLENMFMNYKTEVAFTGVAFANVAYFTDESRSRTDNKKKVIQKLSRKLVTLGSSYEARVNRDLEKQGEEGNFTALGITGRTHINSMLVRADKTGEMQLRCVTEHRNLKSGVVIYFKDGQRVSRETARQYFTPAGLEGKKTTSGRGAMSEETDFNFFTLGLTKIHSITMNKTRYIIED